MKKDIEITEKTEAEKTREKDIRDIRSFIVRLILFIVIIWLLVGVIFGFSRVPDNSMKPKLMAGDLTFYYRMEKNYRSGDVIIYRDGDVKRFGRIVAIPGDDVKITNSEGLYINGSIVLENDIFYKTGPYDSDVKYPIDLAEDEYFILADYREGAKDSRYFGPVNRGDIKGKVISAIRKSQL